MTQEQDPTRQLIVPSGFRSSERQLERIAQMESIRRPGSSDLSSKMTDEYLREQEDKKSRVKEFRGSQRPVILEMPKEIEIPEISEVSEEIEVEDIPQVIEAAPQEMRMEIRRRNFMDNLRGVRKGISAGLNSPRAKKIARSSKKATINLATTSARTGKKVGATTRGVTFVTGKRLEERIFDRPGQQKAIFRPLEARERRLLGLPSRDLLSREEIRLLSFGVTPPSVIRKRIEQTKELDSIINEYKDKLAALPYGANAPELASKLENEIYRLGKLNSSESRVLLDTKTKQWNEVRPAARKADEYLGVIKGLEKRKLELLASASTEVAPAIRNRAFAQALKNSPEVFGVGSLTERSSNTSSSSSSSSKRKPGRPPKRPELKLNV